MTETPFSWFYPVFLIPLFLYSLQFFRLDVNPEVMNSFMHGPDLIFHEAGHVIFMPFGNFLYILGGSLFQCLLPFILMIVFIRQENPSPLGAIFCLWWTGQNMTDVALYISDASARSLPLIGGMSEEAHDWGNLLTMTNMLEYDHTIAIFVHYIGIILMALAFLIAVRLMVRNYFNKKESTNKPNFKKIIQ